MATMNISLPDKLKEWAESQVATGRYANVSDYVRDLIRKQQEREETRAWFEAEVEKGYAGGFSEGTIDEFFDKALRGVLAQEPV
jgi:antitoxin ParD1/3/4